MKALTKKELIALKAAIKGFANESKMIRKNLIHPKKGLEKAAGWTIKRDVGEYARLHLLAYAFMRGFKYSQLEKKTKSVVRTDEAKITAGFIFDLCKFYGTYLVKWSKDVNKETITQWLLEEGENVFVWTDTKEKGK